jgi:hypothetical protein
MQALETSFFGWDVSLFGGQINYIKFSKEVAGHLATLSIGKTGLPGAVAYEQRNSSS